MTEENTQTELESTEEGNQTGAETTNEDAPKTTLPPEVMAKELEKVRREAANARVKLKKLEEEAAAKVTEEAKKRGEYKELCESLEAKNKEMEAELNAVRAAQEAELESTLKSFTQDELELIPATLSTFDKLQLAKKLDQKLHNTVTPGTSITPGSKGGKYGGYSSDEEWSIEDPRGYLKAKGRKPL